MATKKAVKAATTQPAAPAKVQTPPTNDNIAEGMEAIGAAIAEVLSVGTLLAATEKAYAYHVSEVGRLGDELRVLRAELAAERS